MAESPEQVSPNKPTYYVIIRRKKKTLSSTLCAQINFKKYYFFERVNFLVY